VWLVELVLPTRCAACGAPGSLLCSSCRGSLPPLGPPWCARCGAPTAWPVARCRECAGRRLAFASAYAAVPYAGPARAAVRSWKERGLRRFAAEAAGLVCERVPRPAVESIVYVPPDRDRSASRGRQPTRDLADAIGERWRLPVADALGRTRPVARQAGLSRLERRRNVRGAFAARGAGLPARVALVDDVYTTGATVAAAAAALRAAGVREVRVVTFARTVR
jgi:predicted amidophosphoribosyltransferase